MGIKPTIKGIFLNSHIAAVKSQRGERGVDELEKLFGKSINYGNNEDVLVSDEVKIIELSLDLLSDKPVPGKNRAYEAGRLHFKNFSNTTFAKTTFPMFKNSFKMMMLKSSFIAEHVFKGVKFSATELGEKKVRVVMSNNDYPIDHFRGLFHAWMNYFKLEGTVTAQEKENGDYYYTIEWF